MTTTGITAAKNQAKAHLESITDMVKRLYVDGEIAEDVEQEIRESPLSVEVRTGWVPVGQPLLAAEYNILLCTGGPAVRITGTLDKYGQPATTTLEYQDWFTPWQTYYMDDDQRHILFIYINQFYFNG